MPFIDFDMSVILAALAAALLCWFVSRGLGARGSRRFAVAALLLFIAAPVAGFAILTVDVRGMIDLTDGMAGRLGIMLLVSRTLSVGLLALVFLVPLHLSSRAKVKASSPSA